MDREHHAGYTASEAWTEDSFDELIEFFREKVLALAAEHGYVFEAYHDDIDGRGCWVRSLWEICYAHEPPSQHWELARAKD